jgi:hypothetical protein
MVEYRPLGPLFSLLGPFANVDGSQRYINNLFEEFHWGLFLFPLRDLVTFSITCGSTTGI